MRLYCHRVLLNRRKKEHCDGRVFHVNTLRHGIKCSNRKGTCFPHDNTCNDYNGIVWVQHEIIVFTQKFLQVWKWMPILSVFGETKGQTVKVKRFNFSWI